jgi:hypothetical protein
VEKFATWRLPCPSGGSDSCQTKRGSGHGRHAFISHALAGGRSLAEVRAAAGHATLLTTSVYLRVAVDDEGEVGGLFDFGN